MTLCCAVSCWVENYSNNLLTKTFSKCFQLPPTYSPDDQTTFRIGHSEPIIVRRKVTVYSHTIVKDS